MNAYELYMDFLFAKAGKKNIPLSGTFELTSRCNLDCRMCYIHKRANDPVALNQELPASFWIDLAEQCKNAGTLHLLLTGGEPLLRPDFEEIYLKCRNMGLLVSINTNATLISDQHLDLFSKYPPARVNITLYGSNRDTYGLLCGHSTAYDKSVHSILNLKKAGVLVKMNCSATQYNIQDIGSIYEFATSNGIPIQTATYMYPPARACEMNFVDHSRFTPAESAQAQIEYDMIRFPKDVLCKRWEDQLAGVRVKDADDHCQEVPMERINCRAGHTTFWVTWDGNLRPCGMMTQPGASLIDSSFADAWSRIRKERDNIYTPKKCTQCELRNACDQCPAVCQAETGSFEESPLYMCERTKEYLRRIELKLKEL